MVSVQENSNNVMSTSQENTNCISIFGDKILSLKGSESEIFLIMTFKHVLRISAYALTAEVPYPQILKP